MRKLTVKNFSVIKEAELEFGKITVLIGPQSSGKSLLCKLAYFLSKEVLEIAVGRAQNEFEFSVFEEEVKKRFLDWFPRSGWGLDAWSARLTLNEYELTISSPIIQFRDSSGPLSLVFCDEFRKVYRQQLANARPWAKAMIHGAFSRLMGRAFWEGATYIPSERSYFVDTQKGYRLLASQPDPIASRFAELYADSLSSDIAKSRLSIHLKGELVRGGDSWLFAFDDGRTLPLNLLSTGSKELLPLLCALEIYAHRHREITLDDQYVPNVEDAGRFDEFFIEEPEAHIFPKKQYEIVQYFAEMVNDRTLNSTLTITTHSPYILSSFNNLIEADQVAREKPESKDEVARLIPEHYWIKSSDFRAYCIHDGVLESIMDSETGLISANYLDSVSETIGVEFDELLRLGYVRS
jgi:energy-coupling factor transporter ATP-binding protein EcfA2